MNDMAEIPAFSIPNILAKELAKFLEDKIVFGEIAPGTRMVEEVIVRQYHVSRSPVREALRALEQDGLVVRLPRRGMRVSSLNIADLDGLYSCRIVLDGLAAEQAAINRGPADVAQMHAILEQLREAYRNSDVRSYFARNVDMSGCICRASGNTTLLRLLAAVGKQALRYRYLAYSRSPEMMGFSIEGNEAIVDAITRQNAKHARGLTEDLIQKSWRQIRAHVEKFGDQID
jgi:DNA-binding GntR family transcriptional regulator